MPKRPHSTVAVLMGGISTEHEISLRSGENVVNALAAAGYGTVAVVITPENRWSIAPFDYDPGHAFSADDADLSSASSPARALERLQELEVDVAFIALHGKGGEDGQIQGFLQTAGLPFTGSGVLGNALCMDKVLTKMVLRQAGIAVANDMVLESAAVAENLESAIQQVLTGPGLPCVVKISDQGSSHNVSMARTEEELRQALAQIHGAGRQVLVEEMISGRELTCAVIDSHQHGRSYALPPTELRPVTSGWFDYHAKYTPGATEEITPAPVDDATTTAVQEIARTCHRLLHCSGMSRTDMFLRDDGQLLVIEINTVPGLTRTSLIPQAAAAVGIDFTELLKIQIEWALLKQS